MRECRLSLMVQCRATIMSELYRVRKYREFGNAKRSNEQEKYGSAWDKCQKEKRRNCIASPSSVADLRSIQTLPIPERLKQYLYKFPRVEKYDRNYPRPLYSIIQWFATEKETRKPWDDFITEHLQDRIEGSEHYECGYDGEHFGHELSRCRRIGGANTWFV